MADTQPAGDTATVIPDVHAAFGTTGSAGGLLAHLTAVADLLDYRGVVVERLCAHHDGGQAIRVVVDVVGGPEVVDALAYPLSLRDPVGAASGVYYRAGSFGSVEVAVSSALPAPVTCSCGPACPVHGNAAASS